jgi:transcriptional regulator of arginine metabolism
MSKLSRHAVIREIVTEQSISSQDELRRLLHKRGHSVTQATLSRDIHELGLVKAPEGYAFLDGAAEADSGLPSLERLIRDFVRDAKAAQNLVVVTTTAGSAQPVAAAMDAEEWPEVVGTIGGDDTILIVTSDAHQAKRLVARIKELLA